MIFTEKIAQMNLRTHEQAVPALEQAPLLQPGGDSAAAPAAVGAAADAWRSATDYHLRSIGRVQRLWEVRLRGE